LITGASSGIGEAFADVFASAGCDVVVTARREALLQRLADRLTREHGVAAHAVACDLAEPSGAAKLVAELTARNIAVDTLVNCAGFGASGTFATTAWPVYAAMLQLHAAAVGELMHALLPGMIDRGFGRIINVASVAGLVPSGAGAIYGASKSFVVSLSRELDREVHSRGVHVTVVCPGLTTTHFHDAPEIRATVKAMPGWLWMDPAEVARQGFAAVMAGRAVCVPGFQTKALIVVLRWTPASLVRTAGRLVKRATNPMNLLRTRPRTGTVAGDDSGGAARVPAPAAEHSRSVPG
jgi:short-subunit dehydrogenase